MPTVPGTGTTGNDLNLIGDKNKNILTGNAGNDFLDGKGASDALSGGAGNDTLIYDPLDSKIDGGSGFDTLQFLTDQRLNLTGNKVVIQIEEFKLSTHGRNTLSFTAADVMRVSDNDKFRLWGDSTNRIIFSDSGWSFNGFTSSGLIQFKNGGAGIEAQIGLQIDGFSNNAQIDFAADADTVVVEDESATTLSAAGSIVVGDPNAQNFLTTQITPDADNLGSLSLDALTIGGATIPGVSNGNYQYSVANAATQYLAEDQQRTDSFTVMSIDGTSQSLSFIITGINDAPERTDSASQSANAAEIADGADGENASTTTRTGSFVITDVDLADELFFWVESPTGNHGTLSVEPSSDPDATGERTVIWTYVVNDADLDKLRDAAFIEYNTIHISDRPEGTEGATVIDVDVQVNLQGANDAVEVRPLRTAVDVITRTMYESPNTIGSTTNEALEFQFQARDVDLDDEFSVSPTGTTSSTSPIGSLGNGRSVNYDAATGTRDVLYTFEWQDSELDYLAHNQTQEQQFQVKVSDAQTSANQTITVRFVGTNDAPVRTDSANQMASVTEIADGANGENTASSTHTGSFVITDVDLADSLYSWIEPPTGSRGTLTVESITDPNGTGERSVNWKYVVSDASLDSLGEDLFDQSWTIHISDRPQNTLGASVVDVDVQVKLQGANDAPVRQSSGSITAAVTEMADGASGENTNSHTLTGSFVVRDVDQIDTLSRWIVSPASARGGLSVTSISAPTTSGDRTVNWQYVVADSELDSLRGQQSVVENYSIKVSDRVKDTGGATVLDIPVAITLNGANDAPFRIGSGGVTGAVTELASNHASANSSSYLHEVSGSFQVKDVDIGDTLSKQSIVRTSNNVAYGTLDINSISNADASGIRTVTWTYSVSDQALDALAAGSGPDQTFAIALTDGTASVTQNVTISLTGAADGPSFGGDLVATVFEFEDGHGLENYGMHTISGTVTATNMPSGSLLVNEVGFPGDFALGSFSASASAIDANGNATISWTYTVADCLLDDLNGGLFDDVQLQITHSSNAAITQRVSIGLTTAPDSPTSAEVTYHDAFGNAADYSTTGLPPLSIAALQVYGLDNNDTLSTGTNATQALFGGDGNDVFNLSSGTVLAIGGSGDDRFNFLDGGTAVWAWGRQNGDTFDITKADPDADLWVMDYTHNLDHIVMTAGQYTLTQKTTSKTNSASDGFNPYVADGTPYYLLTGPNASNETIHLQIIGSVLPSLDPAILA